MNIEWTLNLGTILAFLLVVVSSYFVMKTDMGHLKQGLTEIKENIKILNQVIIDLAVQDKRLDNQGEQLNAIRKDIDELKHGRGLVVN